MTHHDDAGTGPRFATHAIHTGQQVDQVYGAVVPPLHFSTTFAPDGIGNLRNGYDYGRAGNPTRTALQSQLAALEGGKHAFSFGSGLAAEDAVVRGLMRPGQRIVMGNDAYGGTFRLFEKVHAAWGVTNTPVDLSDHDRIAAELQHDDATMLWVETPSNPLMSVTDIAALAGVAHANGALLVVDNTFASPYLQTPLALGADVVVHSTTKYIAGHSDVVGGALIVNGEAKLPTGLESPAGTDLVADAIGVPQNASGAAPAA